MCRDSVISQIGRAHGLTPVTSLSRMPSFFFNDTATTEIYTLSLHDALPISQLTQLSGKRETLDWARRVIANGQSRMALERLEGLWQVIESLGLTDSFEIDPGDVSRLDYY